MASGAQRETASNVLVAGTVLDRMRELPGDQSASIAKAILSIPSARAEEIPLAVPGDAPRTAYWAVQPAAADAPAVIYRQAEEGGGYLVVALMDRAAYSRYQPVAGDSFVQAVAASVAAGTVLTPTGVLPGSSPLQ